MEREVGVAARVVLAAIVATMLVGEASGLVITPAETELDDYDTKQELVVTFLNDGFEPTGCQLSPSPQSTYLAPYVTMEPREFIVQPGDQENVKVTASFPTGLPPQRHELEVLAFPGSEQGFSIVFEPAGESRPKLELLDTKVDLAESGEAMTASLTYRNSGNVYLFLTPTLTITRASDGAVVKDLTYPRPLVVPPGESYPLTLRQDVGSLAEGDYAVRTGARFHFGKESDEEAVESDLYAFEVEHEAGPEELEGMRGSWKVAAFAVSAAILAVAAWRLLPRRRGRKKRRRAQGLSGEDKAGSWLAQEVAATRRQVEELEQEATTFAKEAEEWLRRGG